MEIFVHCNVLLEWSFIITKKMLPVLSTLCSLCIPIHTKTKITEL